MRVLDVDGLTCVVQEIDTGQPVIALRRHDDHLDAAVDRRVSECAIRWIAAQSWERDTGYDWDMHVSPNTPQVEACRIRESLSAIAPCGRLADKSAS